MADRMMFVNLPVKDLDRAKAFFRKLGFSFNPRFTDAKAACMVVNELACVMLIQEAFYRTFTRRELCDGAREEGLTALSCADRAEVDRLVRTAVESGGSPAMPPVDHGFMYEWSFLDPDGHHWAVLWMDPKVARGEAPAAGAAYDGL